MGTGTAVARKRERRWFADPGGQADERRRLSGEVGEGERLAALIGALEAAMERRNGGVIQLDGLGRVAHAGAVATELLSAYCGSGLVDSCLPPLVETWRRSHASPLAIDGSRGRLKLRLLDDGTWPTILLEEQRSTPPELRLLEQELGLTTRQAQVLRLLACGKSNEQIAQALLITAATVRKHLEHIYVRLGVDSRAQAIARVLG